MPEQSRLAAAALTAVAVLVAGCSSGGGSPQQETEGGERATTVEAPDGPYTREGFFGGKAEFEAAIEVTDVERQPDRTVVRFVTTPAGDAEQTVRGAFGGKSSTPVGFRLVDPLGEQIYLPLENADGGGVLGSSLPRWVQGGVDYVLEAHFPPLPKDTEEVTLVTPSTAGEMTGLPVTEVEEPEEPPSEEPPNYLELSSGDEVPLPVRSAPIAGDPADRVRPLYSVVESEGEVRDTYGDRMLLSLPAADLFPEDEAELSSSADGVLHDLVTEIREDAQAEHPIEIEVHTADEGKAGENKALSGDRADAVDAFVQEGVGDDFDIQASGEGAASPVADEGGRNVERARQQNHRLEVTYRVKEPEEAGAEEDPEEDPAEEGASPDPSASPSEGADDAAQAPVPAPFRAEAADRVHTSTAWTREYDYELDVLPFYRDGEFLVANMVLRNVSEPPEDEDEKAEPESGTPFGADYKGSTFGDFSAVDPRTGTAYREIRIGETRPHEKSGGADYLEPPLSTVHAVPGWEGRVFMYFPAPDTYIDSVTFDAGMFGQIEDVPVE